jgi:hypothetical protein
MRWVYLLECKPWDPVAGTTKNVYFAKGLASEGDLDPANPYILRLQEPFVHDTSIFGDNIPSETTISVGAAVINNVDGRLDYLLDYSWDSRQVTLKRGLPGAALGTYTTEFVGATVEVVATDTTLTIGMKDNSYKLEKVLQSTKYTGGGGAEGATDLKNKPKPILFGMARNITPVLIDAALLTFQIHDGALTSVDAVYDAGNTITFHADYATYALLIAANIPPGKYGTSLATGFMRLGAPMYGVMGVDATGQYNTSTTIPALAQAVLTGRAGLVVGDLNTASFTECATDAPYPYEGLYFPEPTFLVTEFLETLASAINGFWYVNRAGLVTFRQFKFRTPSASIRAEDIKSLGKSPSPGPLHRVKVNWGKNSTVQGPEDFTIPKQTFNGYLAPRYVYVDATVSPPASVPNAATFKVFLNDTQVNDMGSIQFSIPNAEAWLTIDTAGVVTVTNPGAASASATVRANLGEFPIDEVLTVFWDTVAPYNNWTLSLTSDRFYFNDLGQPEPTSQIITLSVSSTNAGTLSTYAAVDNLGNVVVVSGSTINITALSRSVMVAWVEVTATSTTGYVAKQKIMVQHGNDAYAQGILGSWAAANSAITVFYQTSPPASPTVDDLWYDLDDSNKVYRWTGTVWTLVADTRIVDALTQAAGAQATADGKIKTYFGETAPVHSPPTTILAVGDLWYKPSTKTLYRWDGSNWTTQVGTWGADWVGSLSGIPANLAVLTGTEAINNQTLLNTIANDDIISASEKLGALIRLDADMEGRYTIIMVNATAEGLSTAALTSARTAWKNQLASYSPVWNDTTLDTTIFTSWFADKNFTTGWTNTGLVIATSGIYTTLQDDSAAAFEAISRTKTQTAAATQYSACIVVKKDAVVKTTRFAMLRIAFTGGTVKNCEVTLDTSTGVAVPVQNCDAYGTLDLGNEWLLWLTGTSNSNNTSAGMDFYPAVGNNANQTTFNVAAVGTVSVRTPLMALGTLTKLGRNMLAGLLNNYQNEITKFNAQLATWGALSGIPANLATLVGTEAINNQLIINSIANDNILSVSEKMSSLPKLIADLQSRHTDLAARAAALGLSASAANGARDSYLSFLEGFQPSGLPQPKWNDLSADSLMYNHAFADETLGTGAGQWSLSWGTLAIVGNGPWYRLTDTDAANYGNIFQRRAIASTPNLWAYGSNYLFMGGIVVKKAAASTGFSVALRIFSEDGSFVTNRYGDAIFDPYTGQSVVNPGAGGGLVNSGLYDLGDSWFVWGGIETAPGSVYAGMQVFAAYGGLPAAIAADPAKTGYIDLQPPLWVTGGYGQMGRFMMVGLQAEWSKQLVLLAKAISEIDGSTTDWVDGPASANINYDNAGAVIEAAIDLTYVLKGSTGVPYGSGITSATYTVIEGTLNGFNSISGPQSLAISTPLTITHCVLTVSSMTTATASVHIKITRNGLTKSLVVMLTRILAPASGTGGGGGGGSSANQTSGFTGLTTGPSTYSQITSTLSTGAVPSGKTTANVAVQLAPRMAKSQGTIAGNFGPWNVQYKLRRNISGTRSDVGSPASANSNPDPYIDSIDEGFTITSAGTMSTTFTYAVSVGTSYDLEIWATISSGTFSATHPMNFTGSVTVTLT